MALEMLLPLWFERWFTLREVFVLLLAPHYVPFMYSGYRFRLDISVRGSTAQETFSFREFDTSRHKSRVQTVVDAASAAGLEPVTIERAQRVLQARNDKPLWQRIEELISSTGGG